VIWWNIEFRDIDNGKDILLIGMRAENNIKKSRSNKERENNKQLNIKK